MALAFTFPEDPNTPIYADAFGELDISLSHVNECFKFRPTDISSYKLMNDPCCCCACCTPAFCACTTYYVDGDKLGHGKVYNSAGTQILSEKNPMEDILFSNIIVTQGAYIENTPIYTDMVSHETKLLFGNINASDMFNNEEEMVQGIKNMDTQLNANLRTKMNSSYLEYGTLVLPYTNNEKNSLNMSRHMLKTIYDFAPERLNDFTDCQLYGVDASGIDIHNMDNNTSLWLNIPLKVGDSIAFKIYYEINPSVASVLASTPVQLDWRKQWIYDSNMINEQVYNSIDQNDDSMIDYNEWATWQGMQLTGYGARSYLIKLNITSL